jgi:hypothetical protein
MSHPRTDFTSPPATPLDIHVTYAYDRLVAEDLTWRVAALGVTP